MIILAVISTLHRSRRRRRRSLKFLAVVLTSCRRRRRLLCVLLEQRHDVPDGGGAGRRDEQHVPANRSTELSQRGVEAREGFASGRPQQNLDGVVPELHEQLNRRRCEELAATKARGVAAANADLVWLA